MAQPEPTSEAARTLTVRVASSMQDWVPALISENIDLFVPLIFLISAIAAAWSIKSARDTARQRATLDMIEKVESTQYYRELHSTFAYHRRSNSFSKLHSPNEEKDKSDRASVLDYLNHYEIVSIGIRKGILDADIYRQWIEGPFIRDWNASSDFIQRERWKWDKTNKHWHYHSKLFENYQEVAKKWSVEARHLSKSDGLCPAEASGPGDEMLPVAHQNSAKDPAK